MAEVIAQNGGYGNALRGASDGNHEQIVKLLIDSGADVNVNASVTMAGHFGNAFQDEQSVMSLNFTTHGKLYSNTSFFLKWICLSQPVRDFYSYAYLIVLNESYEVRGSAVDYPSTVSAL